MALTLVKEAIEKSRGRAPVVAAMALMSGARVLASADREAAKAAFSEGLAIAEELALNAHILAVVLSDAVQLGAAADLEGAVALFRRLTPEDRPHLSSAGYRLGEALAQAGEFETLVQLLEEVDVSMRGAGAVLHGSPDPALQRRAFEAAHARWRVSEGHRRPLGEDFVHLFSRHWRKLPVDVQRQWSDEILHRIESDPDSPGGGHFGTVELHSMRDIQLFQVLNALRSLKSPEELEAILRGRPEVAKAAEIYPLGTESLLAEYAARPKACGTGGGFMYGGPPHLMETMLAALRGDSAAIPSLMAEALDKFREDKDPENPNQAPIPFWPSCRAYQTALYFAGKIRGRDGIALLDEIPDADLALFGSIEFAAGMLGLKEHSGTTMCHPTHPRGQRSRPHRR